MIDNNCFRNEVDCVEIIKYLIVRDVVMIVMTGIIAVVYIFTNR